MSEPAFSNPELNPMVPAREAFDELYQVLLKPAATEIDLGVAIGRLIEASMMSENGSYGTELLMDDWLARYAFDRYSTFYGDRTEEAVTQDEYGEYGASDPDGSGARSAGAKSAGLIEELAVFLTVSPESMLSDDTKSEILRAAIGRIAQFRSCPWLQAKIELGIAIRKNAELYYELGDIDHFKSIIGVAVSAGLVALGPGNDEGLRLD